jgi:amino acid adenylation domain-containing protein
MLIVHHGPLAQLCLDGVGVEPIELHLDVAMFDLTLTVRDDQRLLAWFEFARDRFEDSTIERFRDRWLWVLEELAHDLDRPLSELQLLPPPERRQLTGAFNRSDRDYDRASVYARLLTTAAQQPNAPAVVFRHERLRYGELVAWGRRVGAELVELGVRPRDVVPVVVGRGIEMVPALLGVLEANAAFVPMDATWPTIRLQAALARLKTRAVVVDQAHAELPALAGLPHVVVATSRAGAMPPELSRSSALPDDPVYGFFTSGSTGEPKLAMAAHGGLSNRFAWMDEFFLERPIVTLQTTPHIFDSAVWQLLWPLCSGGRAIIPDSPTVLDAAEVAVLVERHGVTIIDFVPSVLDSLLPQFAADPDTDRRLTSLRDVIVGGEALRPETLRALRRALPRVRLTNLYGPTEATIGCIAAVLDGHETTIPIGRPIANVRAIVLDPQRRLTPIGVPGELYVGGACLGLGYYGDEEATRAVFVKNPIVGLAGETLYRTGDRARMRPDGVLEFLGRCDDQIKLRGLRIDPGEIESVLRGHPTVREAFVAALPSSAGELELAAWVAPAPLSTELRAYLRERLPAALVPTRLAAWAVLPRLGSGKIDRRALLAATDFRQSNRTPVPPRGPTEHIIADIWQRLLGIDSPDLRKTFFEAGGNSLLALRVHSALMQRLGRPLALVDLFRHPTIADLAAHLDGSTASQPPPSEVTRRKPRPERRRRLRTTGDGSGK